MANWKMYVIPLGTFLPTAEIETKIKSCFLHKAQCYNTFKIIYREEEECRNMASNSSHGRGGPRSPYRKNIMFNLLMITETLSGDAGMWVPEVYWWDPFSWSLHSRVSQSVMNWLYWNQKFKYIMINMGMGISNQLTLTCLFVKVRI